MVRYLSLISYTEKGLAAIKESPQRANQFSRASQEGWRKCNRHVLVDRRIRRLHPV